MSTRARLKQVSLTSSQHIPAQSCGRQHRVMVPVHDNTSVISFEEMLFKTTNLKRCDVALVVEQVEVDQVGLAAHP